MAATAESDKHDELLRDEFMYRQNEAKLFAKYPTLAKEAHKPWNTNNKYKQSRVAQLVFNGVAPPNTRICSTPDSLRSALLNVSHDESCRQLLILEGLCDEWKTILGSYLDIPHDFWMRHANAHYLERTTEEAGNVPLLPSSTNFTGSYSCSYRQLMRLHFDKEYGLRCGENYRGITYYEPVSQADRTAAVRRRVSVWTKKRGSGWLVLMLVDQPFKVAITWDRSTGAFKQVLPRTTPPVLFQGGYPDFVPYKTLSEALSTPGPSRQSLLDDLLHYHSHHWQALQVSSDPFSITPFVEKIIASEYMLLLKFYQSLIGNLHLGITRQEQYADQLPRWAAQSWTSLLAAQRRIRQDQGNVHGIIANTAARRHATRVSKEDISDGTGETRWLNTLPDFEYIGKQLSSLLAQVDGLIAAFSALSNAQAAERSLTEARDVRFLTLIGMIFLPASLIAGIFSMSEDFGPGKPKFWVYFVVTVPVCVVISKFARDRDQLLTPLHNVRRWFRER